MNPNTVALMFALPLLILPLLYVLDAVQRDRAVDSWLSVSAINGAVESSADVLDPFGLNSLATSLMSDLDGAPAGSSVEVDGLPDVDQNDLDPFDARDLVHVLDRVETPVLVDVDGAVVEVHAVEPNHYNDMIQLFDGDNDFIASVKGSTQVELFGPVTVLDAPSEVVAYGTRDGELLCADHGAPFDFGVTDGAVYPLLDGQGLEAVEHCSHWNGRDGGHSFCGQCGTHFEPAGHPDSPFAGPFVFCDNCSTRSVYVDGAGYRYCHEMDGFDSLPSDLAVTVSDVPGYAYPFGWTSSFDPKPSGTVDAVRDASTLNRFGMNTSFFVAWVDDVPTAGVLLVLDTSGSSAWDEALDHFDTVLDEALDGVTDEDEADDIRSDFRASVQCVRVARDAVEVTLKP